MMSYTHMLERIHQVTRTRTQAELAAVLGIRQSSVSDAEKRHSVPTQWYMRLFEKFGVNPNWLQKGIGPIYLDADGTLDLDIMKKFYYEEYTGIKMNSILFLNLNKMISHYCIFIQNNYILGRLPWIISNFENKFILKQIRARPH